MYHLSSVTIKQILTFSFFFRVATEDAMFYSTLKQARKSSDTCFPKVSVTCPLLATGAEHMGILGII